MVKTVVLQQRVQPDIQEQPGQQAHKVFQDTQPTLVLPEIQDLMAKPDRQVSQVLQEQQESQVQQDQPVQQE
jgi:hypothetical protein